MYGKADHIKKTLRGEDGYKTFSIRVKDETVEALERIVAETNRSRNEIVNVLLNFAIKYAEIKKSIFGLDSCKQRSVQMFSRTVCGVNKKESAYALSFFATMRLLPYSLIKRFWVGYGGDPRLPKAHRRAREARTFSRKGRPHTFLILT